MVNLEVIEKIRSFNRFYTKILGLVDNKILKTDYSLLESRILFELYYQEKMTSSDIVKELNIDPSYLSRIIKKFEKEGLLEKQRCSNDSRKQIINLTDNGKDVYLHLQDISNDHIKSLIDDLSEKNRNRLIESMNSVRSILSEDEDTGLITIRNHRTGDVGYLVHQHALFYFREYGFDISFESYVARPMLDFIENYNEKTEHLWVVEKNNRIMGSIAIVNVDDETAQLRWFLLEPEVCGKGLGKKLLKTAVDFCNEKKYKKIILLTMSELLTARALYARYGFKLKEAEKHEIWGRLLEEELWELELD